VTFHSRLVPPYVRRAKRMDAALPWLYLKGISTGQMQEALEVRKLVERAKGQLMRSKQISEEEAFRIMQRQSMDTRRSMREIAEAILLAGELDKRVSVK